MKLKILDKKIVPVFKGNFETYVFAPTDNYVKYFSVVLHSLIVNSDLNKFYDVIILSSNISERNQRLLKTMLPKNFSLRILDFRDYAILEDIHSSVKFTRYTPETYYRLAAPLIFENYDRIMYLDCDICINNNLSELFNVDIGDKGVIAVQDSSIPVINKFEKRLSDIKDNLKLQNYKNYFNAGVMLFDFKNINFERYKKMVDECLEKKMYFALDQDILNIIFETKTYFVPIKYNLQNDIFTFHGEYIDEFQEYYKDEFEQTLNNPSIIHFVGIYKPWEYPEHPNSEIFWKHARQTPYYEEILYENINNLVAKRTIKPIQDNVIKSENNLKLFINKNKIFLGHIRNCLLSKITFGKIQMRYLEKKHISEYRIQQLKLLSKNSNTPRYLSDIF